MVVDIFRNTIGFHVFPYYTVYNNNNYIYMFLLVLLRCVHNHHYINYISLHMCTAHVATSDINHLPLFHDWADSAFKKYYCKNVYSHDSSTHKNPLICTLFWLASHRRDGQSLTVSAEVLRTGHSGNGTHFVSLPPILNAELIKRFQFENHSRRQDRAFYSPHHLQKKTLGTLVLKD